MKRGPRDNPDISNCHKQLQPRAEETKGRLRGYKNPGAQRRSTLRSTIKTLSSLEGPGHTV